MAKRIDGYVENHGSIFLFRPVTVRLRRWLERHTDAMWFGGAVACEARFARDLADGITAAGFSLR